jgi:Pyridoxamine 5'-phosphate oxidase
MWIATLGLGLLLAAAAGGAFSPDVSAALGTAKEIYVATRRKDGTQSKIVPVWFTVVDDRVCFSSAPDSHKVRRIRRGSPLLVWVGSPQGPHFVGEAEVVADPELAGRMAPDYVRKYWIAWLGFFRPRPERVRSGKTVIVCVRPAAG